MALPPEIHTYHCLCTSLLLTSTHELSSLPRRKVTTSSSEGGGSEDAAVILPLPSAPPELSSVDSDSEPEDRDGEDTSKSSSKGKGKGVGKSKEHTPTLPPQGYSILLGLTPDRKITIIRREDGFEKRILYRCGRCKLVVGYEILAAGGGDAMDVDSEGQGYKGKVVYLLPGGIMSTDVMAKGGVLESGKKIGEGEVEISGSGVGVFV